MVNMVSICLRRVDLVLTHFCRCDFFSVEGYDFQARFFLMFFGFGAFDASGISG